MEFLDPESPENDQSPEDSKVKEHQIKPDRARPKGARVIHLGTSRAHLQPDDKLLVELCQHVITQGELLFRDKFIRFMALIH